MLRWLVQELSAFTASELRALGERAGLPMDSQTERTVLAAIRKAANPEPPIIFAIVRSPRLPASPRLGAGFAQVRAKFHDHVPGG